MAGSGCPLGSGYRSSLSRIPTSLWTESTGHWVAHRTWDVREGIPRRGPEDVCSDNRCPGVFGPSPEISHGPSGPTLRGRLYCTCPVTDVLG